MVFHIGQNFNIFDKSSTEEFLQGNKQSLAYCGQNEYCGFGKDSDRRYGFTEGMDSCSALFLWNPDTKESFCFHFHMGSNWGEAKEFLSEFVKDATWEYTPASGRGGARCLAAFRKNRY